MCAGAEVESYDGVRPLAMRQLPGIKIGGAWQIPVADLHGGSDANRVIEPAARAD